MTLIEIGIEPPQGHELVGKFMECDHCSCAYCKLGSAHSNHMATQLASTSFNRPSFVHETCVLCVTCFDAAAARKKPAYHAEAKEHKEQDHAW